MSTEDEMIERTAQISLELAAVQEIIASIQADLHMLKLINKILETN